MKFVNLMAISELEEYIEGTNGTKSSDGFILWRGMVNYLVYRVRAGELFRNYTSSHLLSTINLSCPRNFCCVPSMSTIIKLSVEMSCSGCSAAVERVIKRIPGVKDFY